MKKLLLGLGVILASQTAMAERECSGLVDRVGVGSWQDSLYIHSQTLYGNSAGRKLCTLTPGETYKGISAQACATWYSMIISAQLAGQPILLDYGENNQTLACHDRQQWGAYAPPITVNVGE